MKDSVYKEYIRDRKTILTFIAMTIAFAICILLSFGTNFYFKATDESFLPELAISFALCVYCLFFGIPEGKNLHQKKIGGRYEVARRHFLSEREITIQRDNEFNQWLDKYYEDRKKEYFETILDMHGITNFLVLDLDLNELDSLHKPYKKDWSDTAFAGRKITYFKSLTDDQISLIRDIFTGKIHVDKIPNDYFKTLNGKMVLSEYIEQSRVQKKNNFLYFSLIMYRLLLVFAFAFVFSSFGFELIQASDPTQILERTINTTSRVWTMISSFIYGFAVGQIMTIKESEILEFKYNINRLFNNDKEFVAIPEEELAKREYEKYEKEKEANTVIPERIDGNAIEYKGVKAISLEQKEGTYQIE